MRHLGRTVLLTTLMMALSMFCALKHSHSRHAQHAGVLHHPTLPQQHHRRSSRTGNGSRLAAGDHLDATRIHHAGGGGCDPQAPLAALAVRALHFTPETIANPLAQVNVLALGTAPRAPGVTRGPPYLS